MDHAAGCRLTCALTALFHLEAVCEELGKGRAVSQDRVAQIPVRDHRDMLEYCSCL
jgi:hypothetical protein